MEIAILILCLIIVLSFEFVNGMNDTANAIAPVIYSHSLEPKKSVIIAAILNFLGVLLGGTIVAMSIMHLLPLSIIIQQPPIFWVVLVLSILISAIIWDLGAWYLALPVSSSHALIGSILWVSIAVMYTAAGDWFIPHWWKAQEVIVGLLISPLIWFGFAMLLIYWAHILIKKKAYFKAPYWSWDHPNLTMRTLLIFSSGLVSFMHGKNDGQKWVGIATLILITLLPAHFAINPDIDILSLKGDVNILMTQVEPININMLPTKEALALSDIKISANKIHDLLNEPKIEKLLIRKYILKMNDSYALLSSEKHLSFVSTANAGGSNNIHLLTDIEKSIKSITTATDYVPWWIIALVSIAIWSGTMVWWKRIVKTIWEKIGKYKMNYSQAASSALVTAGTIGIASSFWLPVSTTHVMSSSVAGTMVEEHGWKNWVDPHMIKHILLAWVLTMPTTIILAGSIFLILKLIFI